MTLPTPSGVKSVEAPLNEYGGDEKAVEAPEIQTIVKIDDVPVIEIQVLLRSVEATQNEYGDLTNNTQDDAKTLHAKGLARARVRRLLQLQAEALF